MAGLVCELCGSSDFVKDGEYFVCQNCGMKYSIADAKKMLGNNIMQDKKENADHLLCMARDAFDSGNFRKSIDLYDDVLDADPTNPEAKLITEVLSDWCVLYSSSGPSFGLKDEGSDNIIKLMGDYFNYLRETLNTDNASVENELKRITIVINTLTETVYSSFRDDMKTRYPQARQAGGLDLAACMFSLITYKKYCTLLEFNEAKEIRGLFETESVNDIPDYARKLFVAALMRTIESIIDMPAMWGEKSKEMIDYAIKNINEIIPEYIMPQPKTYGFSLSVGDLAKAFHLEEINKIRDDMIIQYKQQYWEKRNIEKQQIISKCDQLDSEIAQNKKKHEDITSRINLLQEKINDFSSPAMVKIGELSEGITRMSNEKKTLGLFKGREKKELQNRIDQAQEEIDNLKKTVEKEKSEYCKPLLAEEEPLQKQQTEILKTINTLTKEKNEAYSKLVNIPIPDEIRVIQ